jgi:ArsR family transcriptional regulator
MKNAVAKAKKPAGVNKIASVDDRTLDQLTEIFKSLSDRSRLLILMMLAKTDEMHVSAICKLLGQSQPAVSHHLTQLRTAGLIGFRRDGKFNYYKLDSVLVASIVEKFYPEANSTLQKLSFGELELTFKTK